jgi:hypothetical protein
MTRALVILFLVAGFLLIFYFTGIIGQEEPLPPGWRWVPSPEEVV